jgi:hypothetical protein
LRDVPSGSLISTVPREPCAECGFPIAINDVVLEAGEGTCPTCGFWFTVERVDAAIDGPMRGATALVLRKVSIGSPWLQVTRNWRAVVVGHGGSERAANRGMFALAMTGAVVALFFNPWAAIPIAVGGTVIPLLMSRHTPHLTRIEAIRGAVRVTCNGTVRRLRPPPDAPITIENRGGGRAVAMLGSETIDLQYATPPSADEQRDLARLLRRIVLAAQA